MQLLRCLLQTVCVCEAIDPAELEDLFGKGKFFFSWITPLYDLILQAFFFFSFFYFFKVSKTWMTAASEAGHERLLMRFRERKRGRKRRRKRRRKEKKVNLSGDELRLEPPGLLAFLCK